jgi:hypothetical protein
MRPPNYQVQRPATARLARGRGSDRVRVDADRPRRALYVSSVRCNAELGAALCEHSFMILFVVAYPQVQVGSNVKVKYANRHKSQRAQD